MQEKYTIKQRVEAKVRYALIALGLFGIGLLSACGAYDQSNESNAQGIPAVAAPTPTIYGNESIAGVEFPTEVPATLAPQTPANPETPEPQRVPTP